MFNSIFVGGSMTDGNILLSLGLAIVLGVICALYYTWKNTASRSFAFTLALLPLIGAGATQVFGAETNGLSVDKLRPKIDETARRLWGIYMVLTLACAGLYVLGDMDWFDAVCHSFSTMASGGFSTHSDSIGHFHSAYIEYVCIVFLFLTSVNFNLFYMLSKGHD